MDEYFENHFQAWLTKNYSWRQTVKRKKIEIVMREFLENNPGLIEKNYSWPDIRKMACRDLQW